MSQFSDKSDEKMASEKTYWLKLEFYNTDRKMKNITRRFFISVTTHPNFMHFRRKVSFKSALEKFASVSRIREQPLSERFDFPPSPCNPMGVLSLCILKISH